MEIGMDRQNAFASHLLADTDTPAAEDAQVIVSIKERLSEDWQISEGNVISDPLKPNEAHGLLKLALAVLRAVLASDGHREPSNALSQVAALHFSIAK